MLGCCSSLALPANAVDLAGPGIPLELALDRPARIHRLRYEVCLIIPQVRTEPITGRVAAVFHLREPKRGIVFDFAGRAAQLLEVQIAGKTVQVICTNNHIVLPGDALRSGENRVDFRFIAGDAALNRNPDFLYALFVPAQAHVAFPCMDQPDLKAKWELTLNVPRHWQAVGNGAEVHSGHNGERREVAFKPTAPIPTYLFGFAAGEFKLIEAKRGGRTLRMFHRETDPQKIQRNTKALFDLHAQALEWLEKYTGIPYVFGKFDFVAIPSFQFSGFEYPGMILYNASSLFLDASATQTQELDRASLIAHETSHMWFGDLVTMRWFNDVWMKEVFASFMADKCVNPSFPGINHDLRFLLDHYPDAYSVDRTPGANAIRQPLDNLNQAGSLYGRIIYDKAPIMMKQLELLLGEKQFRAGVKEYLKKYTFGNAGWPELVEILDKRTRADLKQWSKVWVEEHGRPVINVYPTVRDGKVSELRVTQSDRLGRGLVWPQIIQVAFGKGKTTRTIRVNLDAPEVRVPVNQPVPECILPFGDGLVYGRVQLDDPSRAWLLENLPSLKDPILRGGAWVSLWEAMLDGEVAPRAFIELAMKSLPLEGDEQNIQRILTYLRTAFWRLQTDPQRRALAERMETLLKSELERAATRSLKGTYFRSLISMAQTRPTLDYLKSVWAKEISLPGLPLEETDFIELALELAVRDVPASESILKEQLERIQNPDRKARFAFVMQALSADAANRQAFFESLLQVHNRQQEKWVLEALKYLHHPLRAESSRGMLQPSLDLLPEIQRTGSIFFPRDWLDATFSGHNSQEVAAIVREFLRKTEANYPQRLRQILLQTSDEMLRASRMIH